MTIHCLGSINLDHVHRVPHFPVPGETLDDLGYTVGLGGKGANQAIAAAVAGAQVRFVGAVGTDGSWAKKQLADAGIDTSNIVTSGDATGHAVIYVNTQGENQIVIHGGANRTITVGQVEVALESARAGDWWLVQNETNCVAESMSLARERGLRTAYCAAPFDASATEAVLPHVDLLAVNEGEANALAEYLGTKYDELPVPSLLVTRGVRGAFWRSQTDGTITIPSFEVEAVDTTGAGDTFLGYTLAGLDAGLPVVKALTQAAAAAAICVTRSGAADAIPARIDVDRFLEAHT